MPFHRALAFYAYAKSIFLHTRTACRKERFRNPLAPDMFARA